VRKKIKPRLNSSPVIPHPNSVVSTYTNCINGDAVTAYRRFYIAEKQCFARWTLRDKPEWFVELEPEAA
jgi:hypothetical protein